MVEFKRHSQNKRTTDYTDCTDWKRVEPEDQADRPTRFVAGAALASIPTAFSVISSGAEDAVGLIPRKSYPHPFYPCNPWLDSKSKS